MAMTGCGWIIERLGHFESGQMKTPTITEQDLTIMKRFVRLLRKSGIQLETGQQTTGSTSFYTTSKFSCRVEHMPKTQQHQQLLEINLETSRVWTRANSLADPRMTPYIAPRRGLYHGQQSQRIWKNPGESGRFGHPLDGLPRFCVRLNEEWLKKP